MSAPKTNFFSQLVRLLFVPTQYEMKVFVCSLLILIGGIAMLSGLRELYSAPAIPTPFVEFKDTTTYTTNSAGNEASSRPLRTPRPYRLSLQICLGAAAIALAILLILGRFTLRVLVCAVLLVGALGTLPSLLLPDVAAGTLATFKFRFPGRLEEKRVERIRQNLDLQLASAMLPPEFFEELQLPAGQGIHSVELTHRGAQDSTQLTCSIQFEDGLDERQRQTLASLMNAWFSHQILTEAADQQMTFLGSATVQPATFGGIWEKWKAKWEEGLKADSQVLPQSPNTR